MFVETQEFDVLGTITAYSDADFLLGITFRPSGEQNPSMRTQEFFEQVLEYLHSTRENFTVPYKLTLKTVTEKNLYNTLRRLPYGSSMSYEALAEQSEINKGGSRIAGTYCANNPFPLIVPCHRIIRKNGQIGEYQAGTEAKEYLLNLEAERLSTM